MAQSMELATKETQKFLPNTYLKSLLIRYKNIEKEVLVDMLREVLIECNRDEEDETFVYDFCIIASDEDFNTACKIKKDLSTNLKLNGIMIEEFIGLGHDILDSYDKMMERSCKILFLITKYFTENAFCTRIQNAAVFRGVISKAKLSQEKCVPVVLNSQSQLIKMPLALSGLAGIKYSDADADNNVTYFKNYFRNIRKDKVKLERKVFESVCSGKIEMKITEYIEQKRNEEQLGIELETKLAIENELHTVRNALVLPSANNGLVKTKEMKQLQGVLNTIASQQNHNLQHNQIGGVNKLDQVSDIQLSGSNNLIGTKIENNYKIIIGRMDSGSSSDEEESEDEVSS